MVRVNAMPTPLRDVRIVIPEAVIQVAQIVKVPAGRHPEQMDMCAVQTRFVLEQHAINYRLAVVLGAGMVTLIWAGVHAVRHLGA